MDLDGNARRRKRHLCALPGVFPVSSGRDTVCRDRHNNYELNGAPGVIQPADSETGENADGRSVNVQIFCIRQNIGYFSYIQNGITVRDDSNT